MKKTIPRLDARKQIARAELNLLTESNREEILREWWSIGEEDEEWTDIPLDLQKEILQNKPPPSAPIQDRYNPLVEAALLRDTLGVKNSWLENRLCDFPGQKFGELKIIGEPERLVGCLCCGYLTLTQRGHYEVCPVCFWEDDGQTDLDHFSSPNYMTLRQGKNYFSNTGACSEHALDHVLTQGRDMYIKEVAGSVHPKQHA